MDNRAADPETQTDYLSYLVRLWRDTEDRTCWRASLTNPHTGQRLSFGSLEALFDFFLSQVDLGCTASGSPIPERRDQERC